MKGSSAHARGGGKGRSGNPPSTRRTCSYRIVRCHGAARWIRNTYFPVRDEAGQVHRVAGIAQDITQHDGSLVHVVDGGQGSRQSLMPVLRGAGYEVKTLASVRAFLEAAPVLVSGCVVIDIRAPEAGGLAVPKELKARRIGLPVIVVAEQGRGLPGLLPVRVRRRPTGRRSTPRQHMPAGSFRHEAGYDQLPEHLLATRCCGHGPGAADPRRRAELGWRARLCRR